MAHKKSPLPTLESVFGSGLFYVLYRAPYEHVSDWVKTLDGVAKAEVLRDCKLLLTVTSELDHEARRVGLATMLVALLPASKSVIELELTQHSSRHAHQFHFAIFSVLQQLRRHGIETLDVPSLTGNYLRAASSEAGHAVWMAGELLGEHSNLAEALAVLLDVAGNARAAIGRLGALHGLGHALPRSSESERQTIVEALKVIAKKDRSKRVSQHAKSVLEANTPHSPHRTR